MIVRIGDPERAIACVSSPIINEIIVTSGYEGFTLRLTFFLAHFC